jgi:hypothetical protein
MRRSRRCSIRGVKPKGSCSAAGSNQSIAASISQKCVCASYPPAVGSMVLNALSVVLGTHDVAQILSQQTEFLSKEGLEYRNILVVSLAISACPPPGLWPPRKARFSFQYRAVRRLPALGDPPQSGPTCYSGSGPFSLGTSGNDRSWNHSLEDDDGHIEGHIETAPSRFPRGRWSRCLSGRTGRRRELTLVMVLLSARRD